MPKCFCDPAKAKAASKIASEKKKAERRKWEIMYVELAKRLYKEGNTQWEIAHYFNAMGKTTRKGGQWTQMHVQRLLRRV